MLLKVNGQYLDFNDDVPIERAYLLLDDIRSSVGDFSYTFNIPITTKNNSILGLTGIRTPNKTIYGSVACEIETDTGTTIYRGSLRVDRKNEVIEASFFSGNSNWISAIEGKCLDLDFRRVGVSSLEKTAANIQATWNASEGLVFPLLDAGLLSDRSNSDGTDFPILYTEDFQAGLYAKTIMKCIFQEQGIKLEGELLQEFLYNHLVITSNNVNGTQDLLNRRAFRAGKTSNQSISTSFTKVTFTDDATYPSYNNGFYSTVTSEWTADEPMRIAGTAYVSLSASATSYLAFRKNGLSLGGIAAVTGDENTATLGTRGSRDAYYIDVDAGDVITVEFRVTSGSVNVQAGSYMEITPIAFLNVLPQSILGTLSKNDFVASVFSMFNVVPKYDEVSKTITCNLFKKIIEKTPITLTGKVINEDYSTFISKYGKKTHFNYEENDIQEIEDYNRLNGYRYGSGVIEIGNAYIQDRVDIDINFTTGFDYFNEIFGTSLTNHKFRELEDDGDEIDITGIITTGAPHFRARFTTAIPHGFAVDDWVRITTTDTGDYLGSGKVVAVSSTTTFEIVELGYASSITSGKVRKLNLVENSSEQLFSIINIPNMTMVDFSSNHSSVRFEGTDYSTIAYSYTNFVLNSLPINSNRHTLCFDNINIPSYRQLGLIQNYYRDIIAIFNDPVMLKVEAYIPAADFLNLSALVPIKFYDSTGDGLYYLNRITGYIGPHLPCEVELIKLP